MSRTALTKPILQLPTVVFEANWQRDDVLPALSRRASASESQAFENNARVGPLSGISSVVTVP